MSTLFLESHPLAQIAFVVGVLVVAGLIGLLVWAYWPVDPDDADDFCADELPPCLKENHDDC